MLIVARVLHSFDYDRDYHIPAEEVARVEDARTHSLASTKPAEA